MKYLFLLLHCLLGKLPAGYYLKSVGSDESVGRVFPNLDFQQDIRDLFDHQSWLSSGLMFQGCELAKHGCVRRLFLWDNQSGDTLFDYVKSCCIPLQDEVPTF